MRYRFLSHVIGKKMSVYGGIGNMSVEPLRSIDSGDTSNVFRFTMENHWGTHTDSPNHFFRQGKRISAYPADFWIFRKPTVVHVDLKPAEIMKDIACLEAVRDDADLLLFRSGWSKYRGQDIYGTQNPGIHPDIGRIVRRKFPNIRAVGMDWVSISSFRNRELGRETHRAFLDPDGEGEPVLIIEDMDLSCDTKDLVEVWVFPLRVEDLDSAPCTVVGVFND